MAEYTYLPRIPEREDFQVDVENPRWVADIKKSEIFFEISIYDRDRVSGDYIFNPKLNVEFNFRQIERQFKVLYDKTDIMPSVGDSFNVWDIREKNEYGFTIIQRNFFVNDFQEVILTVVSDEIYLRKFQ